MSEQNEILEVLYGGEMGFNSTSHLHNFVKYLFGARSGRHTINEHTKNNVYSENMEDFKFTEDPLGLSEAFISKYRKEFSSPTNYKNDELYMPFLLNVKGNLITNFLIVNDDGDIEFTFDEDFGQYIFEKFKGGEKGFLKKVEEILSAHNERFIEYHDCLGEDRMFIEKKLQKIAAELVPKDFILSIVHDDQFEDHPMHHIHRMYKV